MDAEEILILVSGYSKSLALKKGIEDGVNHMYTISMLQLHQKGMLIVDEDATMDLKVSTVKYFKNVEKDNLEPIEI
jgi:glucosamine-6-phosphate deaminase